MKKCWTDEEADFTNNDPLVSAAIKFVAQAILACTNDMSNEQAIEFSNEMLRLVTMMKTIEDRVGFTRGGKMQ